MSSILENPTLLETNTLPETFVNRDEELAALEASVSDVTDSSSQNVHLYGPRGQGKTHAIRSILADLPDQVNTCYIPCTRWKTQYQALQRLYKGVTGDPINNGYHTAELQRQIETFLQAVPAVIVLDEIDFLLLNDGDDLLYTLSRIDPPESLNIITISSQIPNPGEQLEDRTLSSLYPETIEFGPYSAEQVYQILDDRAQQSLADQSIYREALSVIASKTQNVSTAFFWLKTAAEKTDTVITESTVKDVEQEGIKRYVDHLLESFSDHHRLLFQGLQELTTEQDSPSIQTGTIYDRYKDLCRTYSEEALSSRRIGTYLKHLELLNIVEVEYHYGGRTGKTREITVQGTQLTS